MGLLDRLEGRIAREAKMSTLELFQEIYGGTASATGKTVNWKTALQVTTVLACARVISQGIAQVPFKVFEEAQDGRTRLPAKNHPLYNLLHLKPNDFQTSFEYRETLGLHVVMAGAHFSFVNRVNGKIRELIPFEPQQVEVKRARDGSTLTYLVTPENGAAQEFPAEAIWHVRGPSWTGYVALEVVKLAREAIGLAMATEESQARLHQNGARVGGLLSVDGSLGEEKYKQLRKWVEKNFEGPANAGRTMILDQSAKFTAAQMTAIDAQHLETRRYQIEEVCRAMGVMPIMVGHSDKAATYASAEQMFLAHIVHTLAPWYQRIEQSANVNLLTEKDRAAGLYTKFIEEGLLRGSLKDTKDTILGYVNGGVLTVNEGRALLERNPDADPASDKLRIPANITGTAPAKEPDDPESEPDPEEEEDKTAERQVRAALLDRLLTPPSPPVVHNSVDARTTIAEGAVKVSTPAVNVDARTQVDNHVTEQSTEVLVKTYPATSVETIARDKNKEVASITRVNKE